MDEASHHTANEREPESGLMGTSPCCFECPAQPSAGITPSAVLRIVEEPTNGLGCNLQVQGPRTTLISKNCRKARQVEEQMLTEYHTVAEDIGSASHNAIVGPGCIRRWVSLLRRYPHVLPLKRGERSLAVLAGRDTVTNPAIPQWSK